MYPEATMFGVLPSSVFFIRHAEDILLSGIDVSFRETDGRVHIIAGDVTGLETSRVRIQGEAEPDIEIR